jgi:hypothetical protein
MDVFQCAKNISLCLNFYNSTLCFLENNTCVESHGYCVFNETIKPRCLCLPCFTGEHCEEEKVSKNLWSIVTPFSKVAPNGASAVSVIGVLLGAFLLLNGILCLQTYLCKKIRVTNLGIYLIMLSIVSIFIGLMLVIFGSIVLHVKELPQPLLFTDLQCLINAKFVYVPLVSMYNWFIASVAIERVLTECFKNYMLHDSRRRSVIASTIIVIICSLTTLPGVFTVRQNQSAELRSVQCRNFTPLGYILYEAITCIHIFAFYLVYIAMNSIVLGHLLRHRRRFADSGTLRGHVCLILHKHKDFFIPYLIQALGQLPITLMNFIMTCSMADTIIVARVSLAFTVLQIVPFAITFYLYIYLSSMYWSAFWNSSPIGKCLMKVKEKVHTVHNSSTIKDNDWIETRF